MMLNAQETGCGARALPKRFGMVDGRIVSEGYLKRLSAEAVCLYVFLCVVGNREGRSWYSDGRLVGMVRLSSLAGARGQLVEAGLIGWEAPVYTVLAVPQPVVEAGVKGACAEAGRGSSPTDEAARVEEIGRLNDEFRKRMGWR